MSTNFASSILSIYFGLLSLLLSLIHTNSSLAQSLSTELLKIPHCRILNKCCMRRKQKVM